jgi:hypothetical protein
VGSVEHSCRKRPRPALSYSHCGSWLHTLPIGTLDPRTSIRVFGKKVLDRATSNSLQLRSKILGHSLDKLPFLLQRFLQTRIGSLREVGNGVDPSPPPSNM